MKMHFGQTRKGPIHGPADSPDAWEHLEEVVVDVGMADFLGLGFLG